MTNEELRALNSKLFDMLPPLYQDVIEYQGITSQETLHEAIQVFGMFLPFEYSNEKQAGFAMYFTEAIDEDTDNEEES